MNPPVLTPAVTVSLSSGRQVAVKEMSWPKARLFLASFSSLSHSIGAAIRGPGPGASLAEVGSHVLEQLPTLVTGSAELSEQLVAGCTDGVELTALPASDFLRLLDASLGVTFNEEVVRLGESVAGRVAAVMAPATRSTKPSPAASTPSSPAGGVGATSKA
ncbi:MAG: hypothetical protein U1G08_21110 [Verrucomicrobiota bacterium]